MIAQKYIEKNQKRPKGLSFLHRKAAGYDAALWTSPRLTLILIFGILWMVKYEHLCIWEWKYFIKNWNNTVMWITRDLLKQNRYPVSTKIGRIVTCDLLQCRLFIVSTEDMFATWPMRWQKRAWFGAPRRTLSTTQRQHITTNESEKQQL